MKSYKIGLSHNWGGWTIVQHGCLNVPGTKQEVHKLCQSLNKKQLGFQQNTAFFHGEPNVAYDTFIERTMASMCDTLGIPKEELLKPLPQSNPIFYGRLE